MDGFEILLILLVVLLIATLLRKPIRERAGAKPIREGESKGASARGVVFLLVLLNFFIVLIFGLDVLIRFGELSRFMQVQSWQIAPVFYSMLMATCLVAIAYWVMKDEEHINELRQQLEKMGKREQR
jgi:hypothetical protein